MIAAIIDRLTRAADAAEREAWAQTDNDRRLYCEGTVHGLRTALGWLLEAAACQSAAPTTTEAHEVAKPADDAADGLLEYLPGQAPAPTMVAVYHKGRNGRSEEWAATMTCTGTNKTGDELVLVGTDGTEYRFSARHGGEVTKGRGKQEPRFLLLADLKELLATVAR